jgi:hypothetical protein
LRLDIDHEDFFIVADEKGAPAVCRQDSTNLDRQDIVLHKHSLGLKIEKTSPGESRKK